MSPSNASPATPSAEESILKIDSRQFSEKFNKQHFVVEHGLANHPLFEFSRLTELAEEVAGKWPNDLYFDGGVKDIGARWNGNQDKSSVGKVMERIETADAWVLMNSAERHPEYAKVLDRCIGDVLELSGPQLKKKIRRTQMAIFITSPNRLSTYHIDSECNFLLQIRGRKEISVFDRNDREVLPESEIERSWIVDTNAAKYKPHLQNRADVVALAPGNGVHIPVNAPHWVQNGNNLSISAAILYHSWNSDYANVYGANYFLRKLGLDPTPPFRSRVLDTLKQPLGAAFIAVHTARHGPVRRY